MNEPFTWDDDALDDLEKFEELVRVGQSLNSANNCTDNILRVIELAGQLDKTDYIGRRVSFRSRLRQSADKALMAGAKARPTGDTTGAKR